MSDENESKIEEINRQLYAKENTLKNRRREGVLHPINREVKLTWEDESNEKNESEKSQMRNPKMSIFKKFFIFSIVFLFLAGGYTLYNFLSNDVSISNDKIDIEVIGNAFTKGGEELPLQVKITNNNNANLELSDLIISYPKGVEENNSEIVYLPREKIGIIKPGEIVMRNISITLFGYEKSVKEVNISLEYHPEGSNAIFTK
jgi:cell division protein FtsB